MRRYQRFQISVGALAVAAVVGLGYAAASLSPTKAYARTALGQSHDSQTSYTRAFRSARPTEIVEWMREQGVRLDVDEAGLPGTLCTLNFQGIDQDEMVRAFGKLAGLRTERRGDVYSLMRGVGADSPSESLGAEDTQGRRIGGRAFFGSQGLGVWTGLPQIRVQRKSGEEEEFEIEFEFDFDFDFDFDEEFDFDSDDEFDFDFEVQVRDVDQIIREVMAAIDEAGLMGDQKLTDEQKAKLKARLKERLGRLHGRMGLLEQRLGRINERMLERGERMRLRFDSDEFKKHMDEMQRHFDSGEFKKHMEEMQRHFDSDEFKKHMKELELHKLPEGLHLKELMELRGLPEGLHLKELMELRGLQDRKMSKEDRERLEKAMKELRERFGQRGEFKKHMKAAMKAREKAMAALKERLGERGEGLHFEGFDKEKFEKMMKEQFGERGEFRKRLEKMQGGLKIRMKDLELRLDNLRKFMESLTDEQKALAKEQGHLKGSDLTKEQQKLRGGFGKDGGTIRFNIDDEAIKIPTEKKKGGISA